MHKKSRSLLYIGIFSIILLVFGTLQILVLPLPQFAVRTLVLWCDDWILTDFQESPNPTNLIGITRYVGIAWHKLVAALLEESLIQHFGERQHIPVTLNDVDRLKATLFSLKEFLLTPHEMMHVPSSCPTFLSGIGWCDHLNGVAGKLLAPSFPIVQTYALYDPVSRSSPHTVGRVWSREFDDWIYFDIFYDLRIFRYSYETNEIAFLYPVPPRSDELAPTSRDSTLANLYGLIANGWVLNEYSPTFGGYLCHKIWQMMTNRNIASIAPTCKTETKLAMSKMDASLVVGPPSRDVMHMYLEARLEHVLGNPLRALQLYERINLRSSEEEGELKRLNALEQGASLFAQSISRNLLRDLGR